MNRTDSRGTHWLSNWCHRLAHISILAAAALALSGCAADSNDLGKQIGGGNNIDTDAGHQVGPGGGGGGGGNRDAGGDVFNGTDDPREGVYEITEALYNADSCDLDAAESEPTDFGFIVVRYEMSNAGPGYTGYLCEQLEVCDLDAAPNPWFALDVEAAGADDLPAPADRAAGALRTVYYEAEFTDGQCTALRAYDEAEFTGGGVAFTTTFFSSLAYEITSESTCTPDVARDLSDDRFDCVTIDAWTADKR